MPNQHGSFIWYELLTSDPDAAAAFYSAVVGWNVRDANQPGMDYRFFFAGEGGIGGLMALPEVKPAPPAEMRPGWFGYIGVSDVDATIDRITAADGSVRMPASDIEGVGRIAMVADPQRIPFYVMRGASDQESGSFSPTAVGHCTWNELSTTDQEGALSFYTSLFGWEKGDAMPMGEMGEYRFINHGGEMLGAVMTNPPGGPPANWTYYFRVPDIDASAAAVTGNGGAVRQGPMEVPGGDMVVVASDPQGAMFGLVGAAK